MATEILQPDANQEPDWTDKFFADLEQAGPALTLDQMDMIETQWQNDMRNRRCSLVMLTKAWPELRDKVVDDKEFAVIVAQIMPIARDLSERMHSLASLVGSVEIWAMGALAHREDMRDVIELAEAETVEEA